MRSFSVFHPRLPISLRPTNGRASAYETCSLSLAHFTLICRHGVSTHTYSARARLHTSAITAGVLTPRRLFLTASWSNGQEICPDWRVPKLSLSDSPRGVSTTHAYSTQARSLRASSRPAPVKQPFGPTAKRTALIRVLNVFLHSAHARSTVVTSAYSQLSAVPC